MTKELSELQSKYIAGVETMADVDVLRYYFLLTHETDAPYRDRRLARLKVRVGTIERQARAEQRRKDEHAALMEAKRKFYEITAGWEAKGAVRQSLHEGHVEAWTLDGVELYRWGGGYRPTMYEMLADAQRIDKEVFGRGAK